MQILLCVLPPLTKTCLAVGVEGASFCDDALVGSQLEEVSRPTDALAVHDVELRDSERRRYLVLDHTGANATADHFGPFLDCLHPTQVYANGAIELERPTAGGDFRAAEHDADFLAKLVDKDDGGVGAVDGGGELSQSLGHEPGLQSHVGIPHVALDFRARHQGSYAVQHDHLHGAAAHQVLGNLKGLFRVVGLGHQKGIHVHAAVFGVNWVHGVFNVDVGGNTALLLTLSHDVDSQSRLSRSLCAVDLRDPALGDAANSEGQVQGQGPRGDYLRRMNLVGRS